MAKTTSKKAYRKQLERCYGHLYSKYESEKGLCFYCGDFSTELDHCPPLNWVDLKTIENWAKDDVSFFLVSSCSDCNRLLGDKPFFRLFERVEYIIKSLEDKYEKSSTLWSDDEIAGMSEDFQKTIRAKQKVALFNLHRVRHAQWRLYRAGDAGS